MGTTESNEGEESPIEKLEVPQFTPAIPAELLGELSPQERWLFETVSRMDARDKWVVSTLKRHNEIIRQLDTKQRRGDHWRTLFVGKWSLIGWVGGIATTAWVIELVKTLFKTAKGP